MTIVRVDPPTVVARLEAVHPDVGHLPAELNVAARILFEGWLERGKPPHPHAALLQRLNDLAIGEDVEIPRAEFEARSAREPGVWFERDGACFRRTRPDLIEFMVASLEPIQDVAYAPLGDAPPTGELTLVLSDPTLGAHLEPGLTWASAVFDVLPFLGE